MLELRGQSITVYYRGGKLFEIKEASSSYEFKYGDPKYNTDGISLPEITLTTNDGDLKEKLREYVIRFKYCIDTYFGRIRYEEHDPARFSIENEIRQHLVRENNYTGNANQTDYFILDTEYQTSKGNKFDIVAIEWLANQSARKLQKKYRPRLVIFELKYGEKAIGGKCGMSAHLEDFKAFCKDETEVKAFKEDMIKVLEQKRKLGLIPYLEYSRNKNVIQEFEDEIDFVFLIANYKKESTKLKTEIDKIGQCKLIEANYLGYGLFAHRIINSNDLNL